MFCLLRFILNISDKITAQDNKMRVVTIEVSRFLNVTAVSTSEKLLNFI